MSSVFPEHEDLRLAGGPVRRYAAGDPDADPVLLLHGAMLDTAELTWHRVVPLLAAHHRVHAIDLPRHGASRPWSGTVDRAVLEQVLGELLDHLGLDRIALVGLSMGAGVAAGYALHRPERVTRVVLAAPGGLERRRPHQFLTWLGLRIPGVLRWSSGYLARSATAVRRSMTRTLAAGAATPGFERIVALARAEAARKAERRENALDDWQVLAYGPVAMRLHLLPELHRLRVPTLWLRGAEDALVLAADLAAAADAAPAARLDTVPRAGHLLPLDQPGRFAELVEEFLAVPV